MFTMIMDTLKRINYIIKINKTINKLLLAGHKFMPEMHLKKPGFTYSDFGPFTDNEEIIQKFK